MFEKVEPKIKQKSMKKKAMLSQPMRGLTDELIVATREKAVAYLESQGYEVINTLFTDEWYSKEKMQERGVVQIPMCFLAKSLENMSLCHAVYFCKGWENARGCKIEHDAALAYGVEMLYEEQPQALDHKVLSLNAYQKAALETAIYPKNKSIIYPTLGLNGEAGEVADKVKKVIRDGNGIFTNEKKLDIAMEVGDVLWYCATLANDLGFTLEEIGSMNNKKLASRKARGVIGGSEDNR